MKRSEIGTLLMILGLIGTVIGFSKAQNDPISSMIILSISIIIIIIGMFFSNIRQNKEK